MRERRFRRLPFLIIRLFLLVVILLSLPQLLDAFRSLMPGATGHVERETIVLKQYLRASKRLETMTVDEEGTIETNTNVVLLGTIGKQKIHYRYKASIGIDLTAVQISTEGDTVVFILPDPEVLNDSIEPIRIEKHDFWSYAIEKKTEEILEEEKSVCRERYLNEEQYRLKIREATHKAFEETIIKWMEYNQEEALKYIILDQQSDLQEQT